jgi:hypothetical protein
MLSGPAQKMSRERLREIKKKKDDISDTNAERVGTKDVERETERNKKKKDDISDTHKSTGQSRPTIVVGIKKSFY